MDEHFVEWLLGDAALAGLLGRRLYPDAAPPRADRPYATYRTVSTTEPMAIDGAAGLVRTRVQLDVTGATRKQTRDVSKQIRRAVRAFVVPGRMAGVTVKQREIDDWFAAYEPSEDGSGVPDFVDTLDVILTWDDLPAR